MKDFRQQQMTDGRREIKKEDVVLATPNLINTTQILVEDNAKIVGQVGADISYRLAKMQWRFFL